MNRELEQVKKRVAHLEGLVAHILQTDESCRSLKEVLLEQEYEEVLQAVSYDAKPFQEFVKDNPEFIRRWLDKKKKNRAAFHASRMRNCQRPKKGRGV